MRNILIIFSLFFAFNLNAQLNKNIITSNNKVVINNDKALYVNKLPFLNDLIIWYDSKDLSTIVKDGSNYVSQWKDKSGLRYNLIQNIATKQPLYSATNGIVFDGSNDDMRTALFGITYAQPITVFVVCSRLGNGGTTTYNAIYSGAVTQLTDYINLGTNRNAVTQMQANAGTMVDMYNRVLTWSDLIFTNTFNGATSKMYENNVLKAENKNVGTNGLKEFSIGGAPFADKGSEYFFNGYIKELIIYKRELSVIEMTLIYNYLNEKY